jgi:hypothetical protein
MIKGVGTASLSAGAQLPQIRAATGQEVTLEM